MGKDRQTNYSVCLIFSDHYTDQLFISDEAPELRNINVSHILWHIKITALIKKKKHFYTDEL